MVYQCPFLLEPLAQVDDNTFFFSNTPRRHVIFYHPQLVYDFLCRNPTLAKCGGEAQHFQSWGFGAFRVATVLWPSVGVKPNTWKKRGFGVLRDSRMFRARQQGAKHLALGCFWCRWKRSWNVDIENGLALAIQTSAAQVVSKRRARSQTGNLTPDHQKSGIDAFPTSDLSVRHGVGKILTRATTSV
jgi:hypothetical protein